MSSGFSTSPIFVFFAREFGDRGAVYRAAAEKAGEYVLHEQVAFDEYRGGAIDNPNLVDKEAAMLKCDCIVCWHHDWPDVPPNIEVIDLRRYVGASAKVWIQKAIKSQCSQLDEKNALDWALSKQATHGDFLLMYRC